LAIANLRTGTIRTFDAMPAAEARASVTEISDYTWDWSLTGGLWSPDGASVTYIVDTCPPALDCVNSPHFPAPILYQASSDGSGQRTLVGAPNAGTSAGVRRVLTSPIWSPGGERIAYTDDGNPAVVSPSGGSSRSNLYSVTSERFQRLAWLDERHLAIADVNLRGYATAAFLVKADVETRDAVRLRRIPTSAHNPPDIIAQSTRTHSVAVLSFLDRKTLVQTISVAGRLLDQAQIAIPQDSWGFAIWIP
jgi:hypothetical protein